MVQLKRFSICLITRLAQRFDEMVSKKNSAESFAQWGDDRLVLDHFVDRTECTFLEAGANDPICLSQTYLLEQNGWTGVLVEPVDECCDRLRAVRSRSRIFQNALGAPEDRGFLRLFVPKGVRQNFSNRAGKGISGLNNV
jgi:hypothetical protein